MSISAAERNVETIIYSKNEMVPDEVACVNVVVPSSTDLVGDN